MKSKDTRNDGVKGRANHYICITYTHCIYMAILHHTDLSLEALNQVTDGHTRGDGVGVHDEVGSDALARERHVLLVVGDATRTLLPVATGKLVPYLWNPDRTNSNLAELVAVLVNGQHHLPRGEFRVADTQEVMPTHLVNDSVLTGPEKSASVSLFVSLGRTGELQAHVQIEFYVR